jgi:hypothetical protein
VINLATSHYKQTMHKGEIVGVQGCGLLRVLINANQAQFPALLANRYRSWFSLPELIESSKESVIVPRQTNSNARGEPISKLKRATPTEQSVVYRLSDISRSSKLSRDQLGRLSTRRHRTATERTLRNTHILYHDGDSHRPTPGRTQIEIIVR